MITETPDLTTAKTPPASDRQCRSRNDRRSDEKKRRRRNISRYPHVLTVKILSAAYGHCGPFDRDFGAEAAQHHFGMIARFLRLCQSCRAARLQRRQQDRRLHLSAGNRHTVIYSMQIAAVDFQRRETIA